MIFVINSCTKNDNTGNSQIEGKKGCIVFNYNGTKWSSNPLDTTMSGWRQIAGYTTLAFNELGDDTFSLAGWGADMNSLFRIANLPVNSNRLGTYTFDSDKSVLPNITFVTSDTTFRSGISQNMYQITGKLSINKFDRPGKVCSGTFEILFNPKASRFPKVTLSDGTFTDVYIANEL